MPHFSVSTVCQEHYGLILKRYTPLQSFSLNTIDKLAGLSRKSAAHRKVSVTLADSPELHSSSFFRCPPTNEKSPVALTHDVGAEGHDLPLPAVVVEGQVPGAGVQVLDKHCLVEHHRLDAAPLARGLHHAPLLLPVQALHVVVLQQVRAGRCDFQPRR